jgi:uncharacterized protein YdeI (YjbR/CyaY-like superfamily)
MPSPADLPSSTFDSAAAWEAWLEEHHEKSEGLWLRLAKKDSGVSTVTHAQALERALCFGWIDAQRRALDERFWLQRFTPRRAASKWSRINRDKAVELIEQGRMRPAGLAQVQRAKQDGRWEAAYEGQRKAAVPEDLQVELDRNPTASAFFGQLSSQNRYAILYRIQDAKRPETRARRIEKFVAMLNAGETIHN